MTLPDYDGKIDIFTGMILRYHEFRKTIASRVGFRRAPDDVKSIKQLQEQIGLETESKIVEAISAFDRKLINLVHITCRSRADRHRLAGVRETPAPRPGRCTRRTFSQLTVPALPAKCSPPQKWPLGGRRTPAAQSLPSAILRLRGRCTHGQTERPKKKSS